MAATKQRKAAGTRRELQEVRRWQELGYVAFRTPASMGVCDVIAMAADDDRPSSYVIFAEVKANHGNPFMNFRQPERKALILAAKIAGATPLLVHHPPNGERREITADMWP